MPCRAAVRAVAHPATPDPRTRRRSCGALTLLAKEEEREEEVPFPIPLEEDMGGVVICFDVCRVEKER